VLSIIKMFWFWANLLNPFSRVTLNLALSMESNHNLQPALWSLLSLSYKRDKLYTVCDIAVHISSVFKIGGLHFTSRMLSSKTLTSNASIGGDSSEHWYHVGLLYPLIRVAYSFLPDKDKFQSP